MNEKPSRLEAMRGAAYALIAAGLLVALASSFVPQATGAYKLAFGLFIWSALPYLAYTPLTALNNGYAFLVPGVLLLTLDILFRVQRLGGGAVGDSLLFVYWPLWLILIVLPSGLLLGLILGRLLSSGADVR